MLQIHTFKSTDFPAVKQLFYETVHSVNSRDYSPEQLQAWAPAGDAKARMQESLEKNISYVAKTNDTIVGFANMTRQGYIDYLFTHKEYQGKGIASALLKTLESEAEKLGLEKLSTQASITAKSFFQKHGFAVIKEQQVQVRGVQFINFVMEKKY